MTDPLCFLPATEMVDRFARKDLSPVEVTQAVLERIDQAEPALNAFVMVDHEGALEAARAAEARWAAGEPKGMVDGVPVSIKDLVLTAGWPTLYGSMVVDENQPWDEDAPSVARLREHGAVLLGKTTTPEFGHKGVTDSPLFGITRNPWNLERTPGGSSGGAAAAVAAGMGPLAIGTDGGGSVRIPASFSGIYGLKPSFGRVPAYPPSPFATVAHVGPMTRTVADAALMLTVMAEPDRRDWHALPFVRQNYREHLDADLTGLRAAYTPTLGMSGVQLDDEVAAAVEAAAKSLADFGITVEPAEPEWPHAPDDIFVVYWLAGAAALLDRFTDDQVAKMDPSLVDFARFGRDYSGLDIKRAETRRGENGVYINRFFEDYDVLITPTMPGVAFAAGQSRPDAGFRDNRDRWTPYTFPINLTRQPAASIPCGFTQAGLPIGLQIIGPQFGDLLVLHVSRAIERAHPFADQRPEL